MRKIESSFLLILLATSMLVLALKIQPVKADIGIWIGSDGSISPPGAPILREGDLYTLTGNITVNGTSGMYVEGIDIERDNMTLDGAGYTVQGHEFGHGLYISSRNNVTVKNLNIRTFDSGISLGSSSECTLSGNNATVNDVGFAIESSSNNTLSGNRATGNQIGIRLDVSSNNVLYQNVIENNTYNLGIFGGQLSGYVNSIDPSNLVNGKPVYYLVNQENLLLEPKTYSNIGYLGLVDCSIITVENLTITDNSQGIMLANTTNSLITQNTIPNNYIGIYVAFSSNNTLPSNSVTGNNIAGLYLYASSNNTISGNNVTANANAGIWLLSSSNNTIYQNNFVNNTSQAHFLGSEPNSWDNGYPSGGNYWSDYSGTDLYGGPGQNVTGGDGLGDTPYVVDSNNTDRFPLMAPFETFNFTWYNTSYSVSIVSNSSIDGFTFNSSSRPTLSFTVTGADGTAGFCRVAIPQTPIIGAWAYKWTVTVNGTLIPDRTIVSDPYYTYVYFTYHHSTETVQITIPEFPLFLILFLFMVATLTATSARRKSGRTRQNWVW